MIKLLRRLNAQSDIVRSKLFNESTFSAKFRQDLKRARKSITIESPYLTVRQAQNYAPLFKRLVDRRVKIRINTRRSNHHDTLMEFQSKRATQILLDAGVDIYVYGDLRHWKLAMIDEQILWEGSLNILSHNLSREVMRRTDSSAICRKMIHFIKF